MLDARVAAMNFQSRFNKTTHLFALREPLYLTNTKLYEDSLRSPLTPALRSPVGTNRRRAFSRGYVAPLLAQMLKRERDRREGKGISATYNSR